VKAPEPLGKRHAPASTPSGDRRPSIRHRPQQRRILRHTASGIAQEPPESSFLSFRQAKLPESSLGELPASEPANIAKKCRPRLQARHLEVLSGVVKTQTVSKLQK